jgi:hypothetical protein
VTPISAVAVLRRSLAIWARNLAPFLLLTLVVTLPAHVFHYLVESKQVSFDDPMLDEALPSLVDTVLITVVSGAICWGVFQGLRGQPIPFFRCVLVGLRKLPHVLLVGLVAGLAIGIGWILYVLPGLFLACVLYVVVPVAVIEGGGVTSAITRSALLSQGHRLQLFAVAALSFAISFGLGRLAVEAFEHSVEALWTARIVLFVASASFGAVTSTVAYHDLRVAREGKLPDDLARTFE